VKFAIRESIQKHQMLSARKKREQEMQEIKEEGGDNMEVDDVDILTMVPQLTKRHFEQAMVGARKSVSPQDLHRYRSFAESLNLSGQFGDFRFPADDQQSAY